MQTPVIRVSYGGWGPSPALRGQPTRKEGVIHTRRCWTLGVLMVGNFHGEECLGLVHGLGIPRRDCTRSFAHISLSDQNVTHARPGRHRTALGQDSVSQLRAKALAQEGPVPSTPTATGPDADSHHTQCIQLCPDLRQSWAQVLVHGVSASPYSGRQESLSASDEGADWVHSPAMARRVPGAHAQAWAAGTPSILSAAVLKPHPFRGLDTHPQWVQVGTGGNRWEQAVLGQPWLG